ncbi:MAG: GNAT family N-acetyltransferase [Flavobacterium sp.]|nr:GNAT family N-acetyltransferase [Flavobacterium sp.]
MNQVFETERLLLRPLELSDADAMFIMDSNPLVHKYLWNKPVTKVDEVIKVIEYVQRQYQENKTGRFATILKETGEFIGWTGIKFVNDHVENGNTNFFDYGYRLNAPFWNKGYASEATKFWLDYGIKQMNIKEIHAYTHTENGASNRVLSKSGMHLVEEYTAEDGINWNWWRVSQNNLFI